MNKRKLKRVLRQVLSEMNNYYDRMPESALDRMIPAGMLEEILKIDGVVEFKEELAMYCEMLENGEDPYFIMEPAEHIFIRNSLLDFAEDGDMDFDKWLTKTAFDNVIVGEDATEANYVRWTIR